MLPQAGVVAEIVPAGVGKLVTDTASVFAALLPQALLAVTVMLPLAVPDVAVIDVALLEPVHEDGNIQV